jgi:hypothetical protein
MKINKNYNKYVPELYCDKYKVITLTSTEIDKYEKYLVKKVKEAKAKSPRVPAIQYDNMIKSRKNDCDNIRSLNGLIFPTDYMLERYSILKREKGNIDSFGWHFEYPGDTYTVVIELLTFIEDKLIRKSLLAFKRRNYRP